jgi:hypothetical protein
MELSATAVVALKILRTLSWRWTHVGQAAASAAWFYLFPAYCRRWTVSGCLVWLIVLLGYGNVKYWLLALLFAFPVLPADSRI